MTLNSVRVAAADTVALAKFYQSAFGMQEVNRIDIPGGPEIFVNFGATVDAAKANKGLPIVIMHRDSDAEGSDRARDPERHRHECHRRGDQGGGRLDGWRTAPIPENRRGHGHRGRSRRQPDRADSAARRRRPLSAAGSRPSPRREQAMRLACASLVLTTTVILQIPSHAAGPRVAPVPENQRSSEQQTVAAKFVSTGMPNAVATYLNHPALADHILPYEHYVWSDSTLPPRHRAILGLRTVWLTHSNYLWAHRAGAARQAGLTNEELRRIAQGPDAKGWDRFEATLLRAADELHVDSFVSDPTWRALAARYDTNQLIDLVDGVGTLTMHAGAINSLGVEIESDVPDRLPSGIPYTVAARRTNLRLIGKEARIPPLRPDQWTPELRKRFDPTEPGAAPPMYSSRSCAIHRPIGCAVLSTSTSSTRRRCRRDSGSCC